MTNMLSPERKVFRAAGLPVFTAFFVVALATVLLVFLPESPFTLPHLEVMLGVSAIVAGAATYFIWRFMAEVLTAEGVEVLTFSGRHLHPWGELAAVRTYPFMRLICLQFAPASGRSRRVLIFQRRAGEFRAALTGLVPLESPVWKKLGNA
jgi:hypothetical protein